MFAGESHRDLHSGLKQFLRGKLPNATELEIDTLANAMLFALVESATFGIIKHISNSVGLEKLSGTFAAVLEEDNNVPYRMIDLSVRLDHFTNFPVDQAEELFAEVKDYPLTKAALQDLILTRFYYYFAPPETKQRVCQKLDIRMIPSILDQDPKRNVPRSHGGTGQR